MLRVSDQIRVEALEVDDLGSGDLAAWRELADLALEPNPFFDPDFVLPAQRHLREPGVGLLVARGRSSEWHGCLPIRRQRGWHGYPLGACAGWRHLYSFFGAPLLRPGPAAGPTLAGLLAGAQAERPVVGLDLLPRGGPLGDLLAETIGSSYRSIGFNRFERAALIRRPKNDYLTLSSKHERNHARLRRRLSEALDADLEVSDRSSDPGAYYDFIRIESSGWKGREGTAFGSLDGHDALFVEVCHGFAARGRLQLLALQGGGRTVAMKCNLIAEGVAFAFKIGHDGELTRFSPGIQLERAFVDEFHQRTDLQLADSCAEGSNTMINRLWPDRRQLQNVALTTPGALGAGRRSLLKGTAVARRVRNRAK